MTEEFGDGGAELGKSDVRLGAIQMIKDTTESVGFPNASVGSKRVPGEVLVDQRLPLPLQLSLASRLDDQQWSRLSAPLHRRAIVPDIGWPDPSHAHGTTINTSVPFQTPSGPR